MRVRGRHGEWRCVVSGNGYNLGVTRTHPTWTPPGVHTLIHARAGGDMFTIAHAQLLNARRPVIFLRCLVEGG